MIFDIVVNEAQKMPVPMAHPIAPPKTSLIVKPKGTRASKATKQVAPAHPPKAQNMIGNTFIGGISITFPNSLKIMRPPFLLFLLLFALPVWHGQGVSGQPPGGASK